LLISKNLPVIRFKDPNVAILTLEMLTGSRLRFCKIIPEAACDKLILAHFSCSQREVGARPTNHREGNSEERFNKVSLFKISKYG
jgi:hypothetical protein